MGAVTAELAGIAHQAHELVAQLERLNARLREGEGLLYHGLLAQYDAQRCAHEIDEIVRLALAEKKRGKR